MSVITISRGSYTHGKEVAERVAGRLGYECLSRDVLIEISDEFNVSEFKLLRAIADAPSILERFTFGREKYIAYIKASILERLQKDNMVYHGFAGHFFVQEVPHVLKVRVNAHMEDRVKAMMAREGLGHDEALNMVKQVDEERKDWSLKLYGIDTWDSRLYDLVITIGRFTLDQAVNMICDAVGWEGFQTTSDSQARMDELATEARRLVEEGRLSSPFLEPMRVGPRIRERYKKEKGL